MAQSTKRAHLEEGTDETSTKPDFTGRTIEVRVKESTFHVHEKVICKTSAFFRNALKPEWTGPEGRPIDLKNESSETFDLYMGWLYLRNLNHLPDAPGNWSRLAKLYVMGERLMDSTFQDAVIGAMIRHYDISRRLPAIDTINLIYDNTTEMSPGRHFMVDMCVWKASFLWKEEKSIIARMHQVFANDLLMALLKERKNSGDKAYAPWIADPNTYGHSVQRGTIAD